MYQYHIMYSEHWRTQGGLGARAPGVKNLEREGEREGGGRKGERKKRGRKVRGKSNLKDTPEKTENFPRECFLNQIRLITLSVDHRLKPL